MRLQIYPRTMVSHKTGHDYVCDLPNHPQSSSGKQKLDSRLRRALARGFSVSLDEDELRP